MGENPALLRDLMRRDGVNVPAALAQFAASLQPVDKTWLVDRLRLLWKSSTPAGSLDATAWLHETGRLLSDLPQDILAEAIDAAVKGSLRGFMPTVGEIRAIAEPVLRERRRDYSRLSAAARGPVEPVREVKAEEPFTPADIAQANRNFRKIGLRSRWRLTADGGVETVDVSDFDEEPAQESAAA